MRTFENRKDGCHFGHHSQFVEGSSPPGLCDRIFGEWMEKLHTCPSFGKAALARDAYSSVERCRHFKNPPRSISCPFPSDCILLLCLCIPYSHAPKILNRSDEVTVTPEEDGQAPLSSGDEGASTAASPHRSQVREPDEAEGDLVPFGQSGFAKAAPRRESTTSMRATPSSPSMGPRWKARSRSSGGSVLGETGPDNVVKNARDLSPEVSERGTQATGVHPVSGAE